VAKWRWRTIKQVAIHKRLEDAGVVASEDDVQQVLLQLYQTTTDIRLAWESGATGGLAVVDVDLWSFAHENEPRPAGGGLQEGSQRRWGEFWR
jgi:hypothetical protein